VEMHKSWDDLIMTFYHLVIMAMGAYLAKMEFFFQNEVIEFFHITTNFIRKFFQNLLSPKLVATLYTHRSFLPKLNTTNGTPF
jgi:hypothetical protein